MAPVVLCQSLLERPSTAQGGSIISMGHAYSEERSLFGSCNTAAADLTWMQSYRGALSDVRA